MNSKGGVEPLACRTASGEQTMQTQSAARMVAALVAAIFRVSAKPRAQPVQPPAGATLTLNMKWQRLGSVTIGPSGRTSSGLIFPQVTNVPGVYLFEFRVLGQVHRYVGQTQNLRKRFRSYRSPGAGQTTSKRVHAWFRFTHSHGGVADVYVLADTASACPQQDCAPANLSDPKRRLLFERLGIVVECADPVMCLNRDQRLPPPSPPP